MPGLRTAPDESGFKPPSGGAVLSPAIHRRARVGGVRRGIATFPLSKYPLRRTCPGRPDNVPWARSCVGIPGRFSTRWMPKDAAMAADYGMVGAHCPVFRDKPFVLAKNFHSSICLSFVPLCEPGLLGLLELPAL